LQDIIALTQKHYDTTEFPQLPTGDYNETPTNTLPPLSLSAITAELESKMNNAGVSPQLRQLTLQQASKVVSAYEDLYRKACRHLLLTPIVEKSDAIAGLDILRRKFEHSYEHRDAVDFYDRVFAAHTSLRTSPHRPKRPEQAPKPFNHAFTPFLEAYLEQNAFPSIADQKILAQKSGMNTAQIVNWFQNHRSRARKNGREADLKRLPSRQSVNLMLIEEKIKLFDVCMKEDTESDLADDDHDETANTLPNTSLNLDELAHSSTNCITKAYTPISVEPCVIDSAAFGLPSPKTSPPSPGKGPCVTDEDLDDMFKGINIRTSLPSLAPASKAASQMKPLTSRGSSVKPVSRTKPFKAALSSCFSAAITLTCPRSHPALIPYKKKRASSPLPTTPPTVFEQIRLPVLPYTLPAVLPSWELPITSTPEPVGRKKPTIPSHGGKMRPGSPYPKQTISRMSSTSSLASMASDDSQSSSRSSSSTFSLATVESSEPSTPAQSPRPDNAELVDDIRFTDDMFSDYLFYSNSMPNNFFFDINVEEPFDKDVSLSVAEFDKSVSLSITEFETTTLPAFDFFES
jgi:hypothetical protein